uniref:Uncharacterized protein n=1 Tax=Solanum demissum TaxID=50514 RepID=Q0KIR6_SOLDE|nr:hypothetical protein SDM1_32t00008 [Solanum demissum]
MTCHYRAYIVVAIKLPSLDYNNLHKISSAKSDGLGIGWGVRDPRLGRNSTMKEIKEIKEEEMGKKGRERRRPESCELNHKTIRLYQKSKSLLGSTVPPDYISPREKEKVRKQIEKERARGRC